MTSWVRSKYSFLNPNSLSILRGLIGIALPFLILQPKPLGHFWALILFLIGAITDFFDGWLARQYQLESAFGRWVDPFTDKILILAPMAAFAEMKIFSIWWVVPVFIREIVVTFCRTGWLIEGKSFGAEKLGKLKFVFQMTTVLVSFFYYLLNPYAAFDVLTGIFYYLLPFLLPVTVLLTLISGFMFLMNQRTHFFTEKFGHFVLATGVGLLPKAPGTWGSLLGVLLVLLSAWNGWLYGSIFAALLITGAWAYKLLKNPEPDPQSVVIDEVCGIFVTFGFIPLTWFSVFLGFCFFRLFDVIKPFPIRHLERIPGYWGIMADDFGAGLYAWLILFMIFR